MQRNAVSLIFPQLAALLCICCCYDLGYINAEEKSNNNNNNKKKNHPKTPTPTLKIIVMMMMMMMMVLRITAGAVRGSSWTARWDVFLTLHSDSQRRLPARLPKATPSQETQLHEHTPQLAVLHRGSLLHLCFADSVAIISQHSARCCFGLQLLRI